MNKKLAKAIEELADYLPIVFEWAYPCTARGFEKPEGLLIRRHKGA